jgi:2',3'-cyclic-nucleotide 2'-phosphodiesterase (5'-nucleotidase family)
VRSQEAAIGNLFADAIRAATGAELVIINGGGIRGDRVYSEGARVTRRDILDELPFGNKSVVTLVPGKNIRAALENGLSQLGRPGGRFPQVSGVRFTADTSAPPGSRVRSVTINGQELDDARIYRVGTNDFLALGGDGYTMLISETPASADSGNRLVAQDVMDYVETLKVVDAAVEGRVVLR